MKSLALKTKFFILIGAFFSFFILLGLVGYFSELRIANSYSRIEKESLPNTNHILESLSHLVEARVYFLEMILPGQTSDEIKQFESTIDDHWKEFDEHIKAYEAVPFIPGEEELFNKVKESSIKIRTTINNGREYFKKNGEAKNFREEITKIDDEIVSVGNDFRKSLQTLLEFHYKHAKEFGEDAHQAKKYANMITIGLLCFGIFFGSIFCYYLFSDILTTLNKLQNSLNISSDKVNSSSSEIAAAAEELSAASTEQAQALEETAASIEEMNATVKKNSSSADEANQLTTKSQNEAEHGQVVVNQMISAINEIQESNNVIMNEINESNRQISDIVQVITEIGNKTKVINDIVFQTKLLAFNASVEAARAGEHGKGFAVVAEEVGNLATMSGAASKEISDMLSASIKNVEDIVSETKIKIDRLVYEGKSKIEKGTNTAQECNLVFTSIVNNVAQIAMMSADISQASREQAKGVEEVGRAMGQLEQMTQQNASTSHQSAKSANSLSNQARHLKDMINQLEDFIGGKK